MRLVKRCTSVLHKFENPKMQWKSFEIYNIHFYEHDCCLGHWEDEMRKKSCGCSWIYHLFPKQCCLLVEMMVERGIFSRKDPRVSSKRSHDSKLIFSVKRNCFESLPRVDISSMLAAGVRCSVRTAYRLIDADLKSYRPDGRISLRKSL